MITPVSALVSVFLVSIGGALIGAAASDGPGPGPEVHRAADLFPACSGFVSIVAACVLCYAAGTIQAGR